MVPSTQTNFPLLFSNTVLDFRTVANGGFVENASGYDVLFFSDAGLTTRLSWETERYVASTGEVLYWIKVPSLSSTVDTTIYASFGDASIVTDQSTPNAVWDADYKAVMHLPNGSSLTALDSTSSAHNGTVHGATATAGKVGGGTLLVSGSSQYIDTAAFTLGSVDVTVECWAYSTDMSQYAMLVEKEPVNSDWALILEGGTLGIRGNSSFSTIRDVSPSNNAWHHIVATISSTTATVYVDGALLCTGTFSGTSNGNSSLEIGRYDSGYYFDGSIDEVRVSKVARSADYVLTCYNNQNSPSTFCRYPSSEDPMTETVPMFLPPLGPEDLFWVFAEVFQGDGQAYIQGPPVPAEDFSEHELPPLAWPYLHYMWVEPYSGDEQPSTTSPITVSPSPMQGSHSTSTGYPILPPNTSAGRYSKPRILR